MAKEKKKSCFIIMPITTPESMLEKYGSDKDHFRHVRECLFVPAVEKAGIVPIPPIAKGEQNIQANIIDNLGTAGLVLCDMSTLNANVFFELGVRTSLNKPVCLVRDDITAKTPFDMTTVNHLSYSSLLRMWEKKEVDKLAEHIQKSLETSEGENSLWKYF